MSLSHWLCFSSLNSTRPYWSYCISDLKYYNTFLNVNWKWIIIFVCICKGMYVQRNLLLRHWIKLFRTWVYAFLKIWKRWKKIKKNNLTAKLILWNVTIWPWLICRFGRSVSKRSLRSFNSALMKRGFGNFQGLDVDGKLHEYSLFFFDLHRLQWWTITPRY